MQKKLIFTITLLLLFFISNFTQVIKAQTNSHIKRVKVAALNQNEVEKFRNNTSIKQDKDKKRKKRFRKRRKIENRPSFFANRNSRTRKYAYKKRYKNTKSSRERTNIVIEEAETVKKAAYIFDESNFEKSLSQNDGLVVVDFSASWCAPCMILEPVIDDIAARYKGTALVGKLDIDENPLIAKTYEVTQLPTILYIKNGKIVHRHTGSASHSQIETQIKQLL